MTRHRPRASHGPRPRVYVDNHVAERYRERVRPDLSVGAAHHELVCLLDRENGAAILLDKPPSWAGIHAVCFELEPGVVVPCKPIHGRSIMSRVAASTVLLRPPGE